MQKDNCLMDVEDLKIYFPLKQGLKDKYFLKKQKYVRAVDGVTFSIRRKETLSLVGESGCGKTTMGKALVGLIRPSNGKIFFKGENLSSIGAKEMRNKRKEIQFIFQDPFSSLNPRMTLRNIIGRPMQIHDVCKDNKRTERIKELLKLVGLFPKYISRYPHEFSGGQKQRISIARALSVNPQFIVADEPTSSLDVSIQCQILNLLIELKNKFDLTMLFISHDLSVVRYISDRVLIMYLGKIVEIGPTEEILRTPLHPYTMALMSAVPKGPLAKKKQRLKMQGSIPSSIKPPSGCRLHPRCPFAKPECSEVEPTLRAVKEDHLVACLYNF